jgi:hypothetical protein
MRSPRASVPFGTDADADAAGGDAEAEGEEGEEEAVGPAESEGAGRPHEQTARRRGKRMRCFIGGLGSA